MKPTDVLFCIFNYHEAANAEFLYRELRPSVNGLNSSYPFTASSTKNVNYKDFRLSKIIVRAKRDKNYQLSIINCQLLPPVSDSQTDGLRIDQSLCNLFAFVLAVETGDVG